VTSKEAWYQEVGQGMGAVIKIADEKKPIPLQTAELFWHFQKRISLPVLCEGDPVLYNPYGIIAVNPVKHALY